MSGLLDGVDVEWDLIARDRFPAELRLSGQLTRPTPAPSFSTIGAAYTRHTIDREQAVMRLAALTNREYAAQMLHTTGDVRQLALITRFFTAQPFTEANRALILNACTTAPESGLIGMVSRAYDVPRDMVAGTLPAPRPNLRLQIINALGLTPILTHVLAWLDRRPKETR